MAKSSAIRQDRASRHRDSAEPNASAANENRAESQEISRAGTRQAVAADLDRLIHERIRLGIVSALAVNRSQTFNELKALLKTTDGNLSVHARKLEEGDYITCTKSFAGRLPKTEYRLAPAGRRALERYLNHMEALIRATRER
jgi:DNA-binding HxlR family transcriptional regulator